MAAEREAGEGVRLHRARDLHRSGSVRRPNDLDLLDEDLFQHRLMNPFHATSTVSASPRSTSVAETSHATVQRLVSSLKLRTDLKLSRLTLPSLRTIMLATRLIRLAPPLALGLT